ncbi:MAG TPA: glycosyltransferase family 2 protein [Vicinamibacterales bacterium]|nr:glycosyltransferase family 2 protein [Vicinamibacterales bacterium]
MQQLAVYVFGSSVLFVLYVLFGYPLLLALLSFRNKGEIQRAWTARTVSIVVPVHNGEAWIQSKLESLTALNYPASLIHVIFIDDGSTDRTAELVKQIGDSRVELLSIPRSGKAVALNVGIGRASGEILLFTDIRQRLDPCSLRNLVECFADPSVGVVSGELIILSGETQAEANIGLYWNYEKWIRKRLSRLDSVLGATGCLYAMRRELAVTLPPTTLLDDVYLPLAAFFKGYRVIFDERARAFDYPTNLKSEFRRKVRTQAGVYQIAGSYPRLLLPTTRMWLHFVSHKMGRLLLPYALLLIAISSFGLPQPWNLAVLVAQVCFYGLAALDGRLPRPVDRLSSLARTFAVLMGAALCAPMFLASNRRRAPGWGTTEVRPAVVPPRVQHR